MITSLRTALGLPRRDRVDVKAVMRLHGLPVISMRLFWSGMEVGWCTEIIGYLLVSVVVII